MRRLIMAAVVMLTGLLLAACMPVTSAGPVTLDNGVAGTLQRPLGVDDTQKSPVVLMLHGFGSQKDEVGNMYARLADALADAASARCASTSAALARATATPGPPPLAARLRMRKPPTTISPGCPGSIPQRIGLIGFSLGGGDRHRYGRYTSRLVQVHGQPGPQWATSPRILPKSWARSV